MKYFIGLVLLYLGTFGYAQEATPADAGVLPVVAPEEVGMSAARIARIDAMLEQAVSEGMIPGAVGLIARNGKLVFHKAYGKSGPARTDNMEEDAIFRIASQTKAITATAIMILWEEGKFQLDDPISKYIPEFAEIGVLNTFNPGDTTFTVTPADKPITIRHLLTHTSGIGYGIIDADERFRSIYQKEGIVDAFTTENVSLEENIKKLARLPLHHHPGEKWTYSEGLDVLGYLVEIASGKSFDAFLRERIFDPLGMDDTWFYLPEEKASRLVAVQFRNEGKWQKFTTDIFDPDYPVKGSRRFYSGGAGLSSTASDYAKFLQMYLNLGTLNGNRILSRTTVRSIMGNQIGNLWEGNPRDYGLAFGVLTEQGEVKGGEGSEGTFDWGGYFNTQYFADPQEEIIGILLKQTQGDSPDETGWKFRQMVFAAVAD